MEQIQNNLWIELFRLVIFACFVTAIQEVVKGISVKGFRGIFKDLWLSIIHNTVPCEDTLKTFNFVIALICVSAFDFGVMRKITDTGVQYTVYTIWVDHVGTASLVYTGADQLLNRFVKVTKEFKEAKKETLKEV